MTKKRKTVTVDEDVYEYLDQPGVNASGLMNDLLKRHMNGGDVDGVVREFRINQLEEEAGEYDERAERKREQAERLRELAEEKRSKLDSELAEAREALATVPHEPSNPAVQNWAKKLGMTPDELLEGL